MFWQPLVRIIELKHDLDIVLSMFCEEMCKRFEIDACSVFTLEDAPDIFTLSASTLAPRVKSGMIYLDTNEDLLGKVAAREESLVVDNIEDEKKYTVLQTLSRQRFQAFLAAPVIYKSQVIAILALQVKAKKGISESLQNDIVTLCANLSLPLNRAMHVDDVSERIEEKISNTLYFDGASANEGVTKGVAFVRYDITDIEQIPDKPTQEEDEETLFKDAVNDVKASLQEMLERITTLAGSDEGELFKAYLQMIDSHRFYDEIIKLIRQGVWVQSAIKQISLKHADFFEQMDEPYFIERASDMKDLGKRILLALENKSVKKSHYPSDTVLVANEVTASMVAEVPKGRLKAVVTEHGSSYSHAAILAKALNVPFVTNIHALPIEFIDKKDVIIDGYIGRVYVNPNTGLKTAYDRIIKNELQKASQLQKIKYLSNETTDGFKLDLKANVGLIADLDRAVRQGASGVGLYRSEVPFMIRERFPSEDEQRIIYQQVLEAFPNQPAVIRVLDVGADKTLPYFYEEEQNPALGWRGIRMMLDQSDLFLVQIRAMLKASTTYHNLSILLPMITTIEEIKKAKTLIRQAYKEILEEGLEVKKPKIGVMIEVPSMLMMIDKALELVDFISIGSNDLTQYILAIDRTNHKVSSLYSQLHPAMIKVFYYLAKRAQKHNKEISLCGEIGGNPLATPLLIGMGFDSISMNAAVLLKIKYVLRNISKKQCRNVLKQVLKLSTTEQVHTYLENFLVENNLGQLIRAGTAQ
ncbi:phosphoenolpyruvate--protein phosphotransferase [Facilibium subflavum]|uniref:phosphoenolpyruvate--protein phosphotransferase n=1 Tax=Facilibium subflavum TaxID=2219058 RepID=UPI000E650E90|nr:phosphoenolpyruvate--protein phosphotransferase [Facilibium subflavum]